MTIQKLPAASWNALKQLPHFIVKHKYHSIACLLISVWCLPYLTTGTRIEWGDFSFFAQAYEAMRISVVHYHQFPWFNPWIAGGVPLYANPQMGFFSIQMLFVFVFGAPIGLKLTVILFTFLGYASMNVLLRRYFKVSAGIAALLSLMWVFSSFFVDHLPSHFTFIWYLVGPFYFYLALKLKTIKDGIWLGLAFAVMGLSQIHNPFFHIAIICSAILLVKFVLAIRDKTYVQFIKAGAAAGVTFAVIAGHRAIYTIQNVNDFPRQVFDPVASRIASFLGVVMPYSRQHNLTFFNYPSLPQAPYGFGEMTGTIGIFGSFAALLCVLFVGYKVYGHKKELQQFKVPIIVLVCAVLCLAIGFGAISRFAPYNILKHLPVFSNMRVPSRWFVWFDLGLIAFIGLVIKRVPRKSFAQTAIVAVLFLSVAEMFILNVGYQSTVLSHDIIKPTKSFSSYSFEQTSHFGQTFALPGGGTLPRNDGNLPQFYREYEATTFNEGVLQANDALVDLNTKYTPRCGWEKGCSLVLSGNAKVTYWSPGKIVLQRTAPGALKLNFNASNYFVINGKRLENVRVSEPYTDFKLPISDSTKTITIEVKPSLAKAL